MNGPTHGKDVFMPLAFTIGGQVMAGPNEKMKTRFTDASTSARLHS